MTPPLAPALANGFRAGRPGSTVAAGGVGGAEKSFQLKFEI